MCSKNKVIKASSIIAEEFIKGLMCGVCVPANVLLWEIMKENKVECALKLGELRYRNTRILHVWNEYDGEIFDPTTQIHQHFRPGKYNYVYTEETNPRITHEDCPMDMMIILSYVKITRTGDASKYWQAAPLHLQKIRNKVLLRARLALLQMK
ncbi:hypothetical protein O0L34_g4425 [Tuta absoluta]|nr:hypothetical protein O0L34_g4425 [Tuta absoluta]